MTKLALVAWTLLPLIAWTELEFAHGDEFSCFGRVQKLFSRLGQKTRPVSDSLPPGLTRVESSIRPPEEEVIKLHDAHHEVEYGVFYALNGDGDSVASSGPFTSNSKATISAVEINAGIQRLRQKLMDMNLLKYKTPLSKIVFTHIHPRKVTIADVKKAFPNLEIPRGTRINSQNDKFSFPDFQAIDQIQSRLFDIMNGTRLSLEANILFRRSTFGNVEKLGFQLDEFDTTLTMLILSGVIGRDK